ncbi:hypothetical protein F0562_010721 [Nyssa sinensis]|uniref:Glycosyltransferase n=1 Tax=Nyssa sinensis TaxID=561372 RepID=A0A5J5A2S6_9ASTE|nr:hypothetical protein F0562_010721 [Nyssa sinensis]
MAAPTFHIAMFPWFALGHLTSFLHLSNKLAKKGHRISFLIPKKTQYKLEPFNLHPDLITFIPITVPNVDGLPPGSETTSDVPFPFHSLIMTAMDRTENDIDLLLRNLKVNAVFFDFTHWVPDMARRLGIKSVHYSIVTPVTIGFSLSPARRLYGNKVTEADMMQAPAGFPESSITLHVHEARDFAARTAMKFGGDILLCDRLFHGLSQCDALAYGTCRELEGPYCDYLESQFQKPVLLSGPAIPEPPKSTLEEKWAKWLALKPPHGAESIEVALPEGLEERLQGRGVVHGGWVQQQLILEHPSVGCFVTHCGWGSLSEALMNKCQLALLPHVGDQIIHARIMSASLKVGVEVEKGEEDGLFTKESVCKAVRTVMEEDSEVGKEVRANRAKLREFLMKKDLVSSCIDSFNEQLKHLLE